ncbi:MAG: hypothetical protein ACOH5I_09830 [Oligoflexus sp.]
MKNLSTAIVISMASLLASPAATVLANNYSSSYSVEIDHQEAVMFAAALQSSSRDWLALTQDLDRKYGQGQIRQSTLDAAIRNARLFQDGAVKVAPFIHAKDYNAALDELDQMATAFALVRGTHRNLTRELQMLFARSSDEAEKIDIQRTRRDLDDRFNRIRTLYYGLGNLLSTGSVY